MDHDSEDALTPDPNTQITSKKKKLLKQKLKLFKAKKAHNSSQNLTSFGMGITPGTSLKIELFYIIECTKKILIPK